MPLEEVTFRNIVGEEVNLTNLVLQMIDYYDQKREIGETKVTDFNEGSEIRTLLEAYAILAFAVLEDENEAGKLPFIELSYGGYLDRIGESPFINLPRIVGEPSTGEVQFSLVNAWDDDILIPEDTLLSTEEGLAFVTISDCTIPAGDLSETVSVECLTDGADGNIASDTLTIIEESSIDTGLVSVTNPEPFYGGTDEEDDEIYRQRLLENVRSDGFGTIGHYEALGADVDGVHDVLLVPDETYTRRILVNGDVKPTSDNVLLEVLTVFSSVNNLVLDQNFIVDRPVYKTVDLDVNLSVAAEIEENILKGALRIFFDGGQAYEMEYEGLNIGESVDKNRLYSVFEIFEDVVSVSIEYDGSEVSGITCDDNAVLQLGTVNINQEVL